ncbi:hypothetical protein F0U62_13295 [Cystobacter fuscus]|uniref:hypothetical protein n=1 Tax=Cystobacter fuscus TaxID=43 RepID=UPI002B2C2768|nr:hypothetical protein F0U62_13295 [Cystobacter fuscus]
MKNTNRVETLHARRRWRGLLGPSLLGLVMQGCAPEDASGTVMAYVFARDEATGQYALGRHPVENLESLRELRGRDVDFRGGSELMTSSYERGSPFALEYTREADGTVVPGDMHSLYALSLYRSMDRTATLLRAHGHVPRRRLDVLYYPRLDNLLTGDGRAELTDNAAYSSVGPSFLIVPSFLLDGLPMMLNEGVVAHEFGHAVIHQELFGDLETLPGEGDSSWDTTRRDLSAMHEGVADLFGLIVTGDPDYVLATVDADRDMAEPRDYTPTRREEAVLGDGFEPHAHGSLLARAVYELWPKDAQGRISPEGRSRLLTATLASLRELKFEKDTFTLASFPNTLVTHLSAEEREAACAVLLKRMKPLTATLTSCEVAP